ncbi:hypothetical protein Glo7428_4340 [Gloeocapsa sp. PCC 7428]|uniref:hypothetical protein n=1 Tax=Gloeocapsa sp. PCC 7428 TaxID=1173026 RepID=UPI0002A5FDD4|nr:hypothetical protein [Gloeocapsa sp. PCC 7428]AFZ32783.1 hypothetical protein Glo7428_4340 [Gloeocapsa sp. PCC 7428]
MQRISIIGTSGSGKTTLARQISQITAIPHVELDYLRWEPNWQLVSQDIWRDRISQALSGDSWIVDGNCSQVHHTIWSRADTVIWLDYPLAIILQRLLWRTLRRVMTQESVCNGNYETWRTTLSRDSILLWAIQTYCRRKREYSILLRKPEYSHLEIIHLQSLRATQNWLLSLIS